MAINEFQILDAIEAQRGSISLKRIELLGFWMAKLELVREARLWRDGCTTSVVVGGETRLQEAASQAGSLHIANLTRSAV